MIDYPNILNKIFDKLEKYNAQSIIVGGFIRDKLLNITSNDIDIEVYNISSFTQLEDILKEFGSVNSVGKCFGVCKLSLEGLTLDFTLPRMDSKVASGHKGFNIKIYKDINFTQASQRRDFTINTIGYDVKEKKILDPFNGIDDLQNRVLKMVDEKSFVEDPLRVLRAVQFCARFKLKMDEKLFSLCKNMVMENMLIELPKERIYQEIKKLLLKSSKPSIGFKLLKKLEALHYFNQCSDSMKAVDRLAQLNIANKKSNEVLMLGALCYKFSESEVSNFISKLSDSKELLKRVSILVKNLNTIPSLCSKPINDYDIYKLSTKVNIEELTTLSNAIYSLGSNVAKRAKDLNVLNDALAPLLKGKDLILLGLKPSADFSSILELAYEAQMREEFTSYDEAIIWLKNYLTNSL